MINACEKLKQVDVLLVEDNPHEAKLTIMSLKEHNLCDNMKHVDDGAEALDFLFARGKYNDRKSCTNPKIIILDLNLPKVDGLEVLRQIRADEQTKSIPVVILSSSKLNTDVLAGYKLGVNSYVVKPMDFDDFIKTVGGLGLYWMITNERPTTM